LIGNVNTEKSIIPGPGQIPPIPQPNPKQTAPKTRRQSIGFCGLNNYLPRYDTFLNYVTIT